MRASERYGIFCSLADLVEISSIIRDQKAKFVERQSNRLTVWDLFYQGKEVRVIYDSHRKSIVTFLPYECVGDGANDLHAEVGDEGGGV